MTEKKYKISIEPRILELLGPNLYTNIYYVLGELIANAYDAGASNVYIIEEPGELRVEDDGRGMSYARGEVDAYLQVARESRSSESDSLTPEGRKRMGRKGVGKLAALSVSEFVDVMTVADGEYSGFVMDRGAGGTDLEPITRENISFREIVDHGTAIVMRDPAYRLNRTRQSVRRNLLKLFPLVDENFRIHVRHEGWALTIDSWESEVAEQLSTIITLGEKFSDLAARVPDAFPEERDDLVSTRDPVVIPLTIGDRLGAPRSIDIVIEGWIGTYTSTRGRKGEQSDFPDNFISLFANGKLGEFSILPIVGQNKLNEVYVVGQLHVDAFESSDLPDMALSNRQGYRTDDARYRAVIEHVRTRLLPEVLRRRARFASLRRRAADLERLNRQRAAEGELREVIDNYREGVTRDVAQAISGLSAGIPRADIETAVKTGLSRHDPGLGLKAKVDEAKKKVLISHTRRDKDLGDVIEAMLVHNGVSRSEILYTSSDYGECRIPDGVPVYDYLREFFVESYSDQKIIVLFVTSKKMDKSWGGLSKLGLHGSPGRSIKSSILYLARLGRRSTWQSSGMHRLGLAGSGSV